jgi:hypothetical protein
MPPIRERICMRKTAKVHVILLGTVGYLVGGFSAPVLCDPPQLPAPKHSEYRIAIHCSLRALQVWRGTKMIREYPIEIGVGLAKRRSGDHRTPLGNYEISWMASRNSSKGYRIKDGTSWCRENRFVYAKAGPPLEKLWTRAYGGDRATVISINYPNAKDLSMGYTGSCIHIHADTRLNEGVLKKSYGCIHMFPKDAEELYELVEVGTPVKILP